MSEFISAEHNELVSGTFDRMPNGELRTSIPEPYWYRGWQTLFQSRPACWPCLIIFSSREEYEDHYIRCHLMDMENLNNADSR